MSVFSTIEEAFEVKRLWTQMWRRKWLVAVGTMVVFLSIGAAAWAAAGDGTQLTGPEAASQGAAGAVPALAETSGTGQATLAATAGPGGAAREALKEKRELKMKHLQGLMKLVREKMTPEDQATYDGLVQTAKDQREALQQARQALGKTLKEIRELTKKYIDAN